ncbi:probable ATP-dependent RNA helicase DDX31 [Austrofundulus limnaeus]|uniref:ATP-dependent RNA helicase n=1 Tax=Austrofundulus limnaeus TaxID=52670 RepID=A0A2I4CE44_AUSLI|nr:PREDICTED: probable ATP-dependent RNA helicase DDX31 [Austrofundulus limnaeus]
MMSSADGQLCLNISESLTSSSFPSSRKRLKPQQKWALKKQRAERKRRINTEEEEQCSAKQRRQQLHHTAEEEEEEEEEEEAAPPVPLQAPPTETTHRTPQKNKKERKDKKEERKDKKEERKDKKEERKDKKEERKDKKKTEEETKTETHSSIKTSSLFKNNPEIPEIHRPTVSKVKEKIFTSDSFSDLHLHPHLVATLNKVLNVSTLTSVQKQTIPALLSGRDALVRSQTGSGKTLSYAVPLVQSLQSVQPKVSRSDGPLALIIVPTRELALQTFQTFQKLLKPFTWIVPGVLMGGEKRKAEKARIRKGINILISTPGRLVDHIKHTLSIAFSAVRWLVLDEADRTLDLGFEKDLTVILNSLNSTGPARQNVLLSATLTQGVTRLVDVCLKDPVSIHVSGSASSDITAAAGQSESFSVPEALRQLVAVVPSKLRLVCLAAFLLEKCKFSDNNKVIVFVSSCEAVEFLHTLFTCVLSKQPANQQLRFLRLHGNMKQEDRSQVYEEFSASGSGVLLCTDVAARGLDLPQVTWIIQYTPPTSAAEYVHRVGRTARIGGRGNGLLFLTPTETAFVTELANHNISLSEVKLQDLLSCLMMDDAYRGRGKYHSQSSSKALEQEVRERATVLQTEFETFVHSSATSLQAAKTALQSFLRAYTTYPTHLKHIFHIRSLHLGHAAKSFGLRDAPQGLSRPGNQGRARNQARKPAASPGKNQNQNQNQSRTAEKRKFHPGRREAVLIRSEFSSGLEGGARRRKRNRGQEEEEGD